MKGKTICTIAIILIIGNHCFGQSIALLPLSNAEWEYENTDPGGSIWIHQYIIGESEIGDYLYTKFKIDEYFVDWSVVPNVVDSISSTSREVLIRIDSGRIFSHVEDSEDRLLFDTRWNVGDTIIDKDADYDSIYVLIEIDTVSYNEINRRRWLFDNPTMGIGPVSFIEGIGGMNFNISEPIFDMFWEGRGILQCFIENNTHILGNKCLKSLTSSSEISHNEFSVFPNPTEKILNVNFGSQYFSHAVASIIDINGRIVYTENLYDNNGTIVLPDDLCGIYVFKISLKDMVWQETVVIN